MGFFKKVYGIGGKIGKQVRKVEDYLDKRDERAIERAGKKTKYYEAQAKRQRAFAALQKAKAVAKPQVSAWQPNTSIIMGDFGKPSKPEYETMRVPIRKKKKHQKYRIIRKPVQQKNHGNYLGF